MKNLTSFLFLVLFLLNVFIYYPVFLLLQSGIKSEVAVNIEKQILPQDITVFTIQQGEAVKWEWLEKNEFCHNGIMYDVIKKEKKGNITFYYCRADHKEMRLFEGLNHFVKNISDTQNTEKKESKSSQIKDFFKDYFPVNKEYTLFNMNKEFRFNISTCSFLSFVPEKQSPPPKIG